jgi:hypothetical protein
MKSLANATILPSCLVLLTLAGLAIPAEAGEWDKKTIMTITEPLQLPNVVLDPGTYVFKLLDSQSDRHIVQVFNREETHIITTILAIPNYRLQVTDKTEFAFWETPAGQPRALRAWFYPGDNFGQEFAYPKTMIVQIVASNSSATVPEDVTTVATATVETPPAPQPVVAESEPAPVDAPVVVAAAEPAPVSEPVMETPAPQPELPQTASAYPLIALVGLFSLVAFTILTVRAKRAL